MKSIPALALAMVFCGGAWAAEMVAAGSAPGSSIVPTILAKGFHVHASALSPYVLVHSDAPTLKLFQNLDAAGLGGPTQIAFADDHKVRIVPPSTTIDPSSWTESWMLFWFTGAKGWDKLDGAPLPIDVPILVVLQHLPTRIAPAGTGVELTFPAEAGFVSIVPLYGSGLFAAAESAKWKGTLPDDVFKRCRLLAEISREFPVSLEEAFKIHPGQDKLLVRDRVEFFSIDDDFATPHRKLAPMEPAIALAQKQGFRLLGVPTKPFDPGLPTMDGPYIGVEAEEFSYTLTGLLRYVNQAEPTMTLSDPAGNARDQQVRTAPHWGAAVAAGFEAELSASVTLARLGYRAQDEDAYRLGCYRTAKALTALWSTGIAAPKWMQEQNFGAVPTLAFAKPSPEQIRFIKDRMPEYAGRFPTAAPKTVLLWKDGPWIPKPDWMFRHGLSQQAGTTSVGPVFAVEGAADAAMLTWRCPAGITASGGRRSAGLPLCGISK